MATVEEIIVRYSAEDLLSGPTRRARGEVDQLRLALERLNRTTADPKVQLQGLAGAAGQAQRQVAGLTQAQRDYNSVVGETVRQGYRFTSWVGNEVVRAGRDGTLALGALGAAFTAMGLKAAGGFEMAQVALSAITGSQAMGRELMNWSVRENLRTVFTQADIQRGLQSELALGVPIASARPMLQAAENLTAASGNLGNLPDVVMALSKVTAGGHMTGREFNQLALNGIPIAQIISENTGQSTNAIVQAAHNGSLDVTAEQFQSWLTSNSGPTLTRLGAGGGLAHRMNETLLGQVDTAKDAAMQALRQGFQPELPAITRGVEGFSKALNPFLQTQGRTLADIVLHLEHFFTAALPAAMPVIDAFFKGIDHVMAAHFDGTALDKLGGRTGDSITRFFNSAAKDAPVFFDAVVAAAGVIPAVLGDLVALEPVLKDMAEIVKHLASNGFGQQLLALGATGALGVHVANSATGGIAGNVGQYLLLRQLMMRGGGGAPAAAAGASVASRLGGAAAKAGGAALIAGGALDAAHNLTTPGVSWGGLLHNTITGAMIGGGVGAVGGLGVFDEVSIPLLAGGGALIGAGAYGVKALLGGNHHHTDNSIHTVIQSGAFQGMTTNEAADFEELLRQHAAEIRSRQGGGR